MLYEQLRKGAFDDNVTDLRLNINQTSGSTMDYKSISHVNSHWDLVVNGFANVGILLINFFLFIY